MQFAIVTWDGTPLSGYVPSVCIHCPTLHTPIHRSVYYSRYLFFGVPFFWLVVCLFMFYTFLRLFAAFILPLHTRDSIVLYRRGRHLLPHRALPLFLLILAVALARALSSVGSRACSQTAGALCHRTAAHPSFCGDRPLNISPSTPSGALITYIRVDRHPVAIAPPLCSHGGQVQRLLCSGDTFGVCGLRDI
jgi:hypothetical protein